VALKFGNGIDLVGQKLVNVGDPAAGTDGANKQYVDALVRGLSWKQSVVAASTANVTLSSAPATLDGVTLTLNDRVLLKNQTAAAENGVYVYASTGAALTRATDSDTATKLIGATVTVTKGSTLADKVFRLVTDDVTLETTALVWTEVGGSSASYTAGDGLGESPAGTFNVTTGTGLEISSDAVRISTAAAGAGLTGGGGSALTVGQGTGITVNADDIALASSVAGAGLTHSAGVLNVVGDASITVAADSLGLAAGVAGTGLTLTTGVLNVVAGSGITANANDIAVNSTVARVYAANIGDGSTTNIVVTHSLGTRDVAVTVRNASSPYEEIMVDNEATSTTTCTLKFAVAPTSNQYRVIVQGVGA
jgi:hypothetical protein